MKQKQQKILLCILDGWGEGKKYKGNALWMAKTPNFDAFKKKYPWTLLKAHGHDVGVPSGIQGGSEPGHLTIGSGRVVWQPFEEINRDIRNKKFFKKKLLLQACEKVKKKNSVLHLIGMVSDGGVHSHIIHLDKLVRFARKRNVKNILIHAIADGRDVREQSIGKYLRKIKNAKTVSLIGRYYAMDRDTNWNRTKIAYLLYAEGKGMEVESLAFAAKEYYKKAKKNENTDYYLPPLKTKDFKKIEKKDSVIFFNFRSDRARQLTWAFCNKDFSGFKRKKIKCFFINMGPAYTKDTDGVVYRTPEIKNNLGYIINKKGISQLRIAETEKYAHVTFFFNSQVEKPFSKEDRIMVPSPKVSSYADKPEMSAYKITKKLLKEIKKEKYGLIVLNYANLDLVGHSGNIRAVIKATEVIDSCIGEIVARAQKYGYEIILTADHGNSEEMIYYGTNIVSAAHTLNPVPFILVSDRFREAKLLRGQGLSSVAPTILYMMGIKKPKEMTGKSLIS